MLPSIPLRPPFATVANTTMQTADLRYIFGMAKKGDHLLGNATPRLFPWLLLSAVPVGHIWLMQQREESPTDSSRSCPRTPRAGNPIDPGTTGARPELGRW